MLSLKKENLCLKENNLYLQPQNFLYMQARFIRNLLVFCFCMVFTQATKAQNAARIYVEPDGWSIGTDFGMTDLWGDVGTKSIIDHYTNSKYTNKMCFMGGLFGRYTVHPCFAIRMMLNYGVLYATDQWNYDKVKGKNLAEGSDVVQRFLREQNAKDQTFESTVLFELMPFRFNPESKSAHRRGQLFFGAGIGVFHFVPYSTEGNSNTYVKTYDLHLEGQGWGGDYPKNYSLWQPAIPLAIGYRWDIGQHLNLGFEFMYRYCFTDYLDGVSGKYVDPPAFYTHMPATQAATAEAVADKEPYFNNAPANTAGNLRGNPGNDAYSTITITFSYKIFARNNRWWLP